MARSKTNIFYLIGFAVVLGLKFFYSRAGNDELAWILAPTAWWVRVLSGIPFENEPGIGYVNHSFRFIIAPSCSGIQFMLITIATLIFSFVHRMKTLKKGFGWIAFSIGFSCLFTIFVNGIRITIAIYLPILLENSGIYRGWLTPDKLHTIIGIVVYFTSLCVVYFAIEALFRKKDCAGAKSNIGLYVPPLFWYFFIALGIPFLNRAFQSGHEGFGEYALLITGICLPIIFLFYLISARIQQTMK